MVQSALGVHFVHQRHHLGDGGIELHLFNIFGNLLDGLVHGDLQFIAVLIAVHQHFLQAPHAVQELAAAAGAVGAPRNGLVESAHEHFIHTESIGADIGNDFIGVFHVAPALAHLFAVGTQDHALSGTLHVGFGAGDLAQIVDSDVYLCGHTHLPAVFREGFYRVNKNNNSIQYVDRLFVNAAAALNYGGYGDKAGFKPASKQRPVIYLDGKRHRATARV